MVEVDLFFKLIVKKTSLQARFLAARPVKLNLLCKSCEKFKIFSAICQGVSTDTPFSGVPPVLQT